MCTWRVFALIVALLVLCADPPRTCEREGGVFSATFLVTWGGVAPCSESSNQIAEHIIICEDAGNRAQDSVRMECMGNVMITFFMPFNPAPCDKKSRSEHQTLPTFREGLGTRLGTYKEA